MLYRDVLELIDTGTIFVQILSRFTQTAAGISAAAARNWNVAEEHFRIALEQAQALPNQLEHTEIQRFNAMMLLDRAAPGDREKAQTLLRGALDIQRHLLVGLVVDELRALGGLLNGVIKSCT